MRTLRTSIVMAVLVTAAAATSAQGACRVESEICAAGSPWLRANNATVRVEFAGTGERAVLAFSFLSPSNVVIDTEHHEKDKAKSGRVLLVDGQMMLTRDVELEKGREIQALDGPLLFYQLAISLLSTAFPEGPDGVQRRSIVDLEEGRRGIFVETSSTSGFFGAPWHMKGSVNRTSPDSIAYAFEFEFTSAKSRRELRLDGTWSSDAAKALDPALSLMGWTAFFLEPRVNREGGGMIRSYEAKATTALPAITLGELRDALRPGHPSRSRWKPMTRDAGP